MAGGVLTLWLWSMLHATVAVLLVWYRLVVPVRQALRHSLRVTEVRAEGPGVVSVVVQGIGLDELRAEPGQFFRWRFLQRRLWRTSLPFSLSAPVRDDTLRITVKARGDHTRRMRRLRPGIRVLATGPFGALTAHRRTRRKVLLLAGGVGITPMRALFETLPGGPGDLTLLYRAGNADQFVLRDELEAIAAARGAALHYLLGPLRRRLRPARPARPAQPRPRPGRARRLSVRPARHDGRGHDRARCARACPPSTSTRSTSPSDRSRLHLSVRPPPRTEAGHPTPWDVTANPSPPPRARPSWPAASSRRAWQERARWSPRCWPWPSTRRRPRPPTAVADSPRHPRRRPEGAGPRSNALPRTTCPGPPAPHLRRPSTLRLFVDAVITRYLRSRSCLTYP